MTNCGNIIIHCNQSIDFSKYDFGISQPNKTAPYFWGGESTMLEGSKVQRFEGLQTGTYSWFVRRKSDLQILNIGQSQVNCSSESIKTFFFNNIFTVTENNYTFDTTTKRINLFETHELFGRNFEILNSSLNGIVVKTSTGIIEPNLPTFDDITFYQNSFNLSEQFLLDENLFSVMIQFF